MNADIKLSPRDKESIRKWERIHTKENFPPRSLIHASRINKKVSKVYCNCCNRRDGLGGDKLDSIGQFYWDCKINEHKNKIPTKKMSIDEAISFEAFCRGKYGWNQDIKTHGES